MAFSTRLSTIGSVRRLLPVCIALLLAFVLSSCDVSFTSYAARVDGDTVSDAELTTFLQAAQSNAAFRCVEASSSSTGSVAGAGDGTFAAAYVANSLTGMIDARLAGAAIGRLGIITTPLARSIAGTELAAQLSPPSGSSCKATGQAVLSSLPASVRSELVQDQTEETVLSAYLAGYPLSAAGVAAYGAKHQASLRLACVSAILLSSKAEGTALRADILGGASFAAVAKANSLDTGSAANGGSVGCHAAVDYTSPLNTIVAALKLGQLSQVLTFGTSYVLLEVTSYKPPSSSAVAAALVSSGYGGVTAYLGRLAGDARVEVDAKYGTWAKSGGSWAVRPASGPSNHLLANPAAVTHALVAGG